MSAYPVACQRTASTHHIQDLRESVLLSRFQGHDAVAESRLVILDAYGYTL